MTDTTPPGEGPDDADVHEQKAVRLAKRERLLDERVDAGGGAYPVTVPVTDAIAELRARYGELEAGAETGVTASVAGRIVFSRNTGKLCFATLQSGDGSRVQAMVSLAEVGDESLRAWKELVDLGDHVSVTGQVISSRRGELSIMVSSWQIAAKALLPLPNLYTELSEESRVRSRYLDLIVRDQARRTVLTRAAVMASLRQSFAGHGFIEIETPMLQVQHGGAAARPFVTHSNAFDTDLYLRIAPELFLKRAVVGGLERVFEINRNFRNEGADSTHSPEFAMLEFYQAYSDYHAVADLTQELVQNAARAIAGSTTVTWAVSFRPAVKWELAVDLQWTGWSAYKALNVAFNEKELGIKPIYSVKNYSNTLAFRFGAQYRATDFITARMGMYVDESPVSSDYLNPETPSMTKVSYTAGLSLRPTKFMSIDLAYCYVSSADPERTGSYPLYGYTDGNLEEVFSGNYTLHANVFSIGVGFSF